MVHRFVVVPLVFVAAGPGTVAVAGEKAREVLLVANDIPSLSLADLGHGSTEKDTTYFVEVPQGKRTDRISEAIAALHGAEAVDVAWAEKKAAK